MGIELIIIKSYDRDFKATGEEISLEGWMSFVECNPDLRLKTTPHVAIVPSSGQTIKMPPLQGETELKLESDFVSFLHYRHGDLIIRLNFNLLENSENPVRKKISEVAKHFNAIIAHDAGDELLYW